MPGPTTHVVRPVVPALAAVAFAPARSTAGDAQWVRKLDDLHLLTPLRIVAIIVVALLVTVAVRVVVDRLLRRTFVLPGTDPERADARRRALASALRSSLFGVVWAAAVVTIVSEIGINIGAFVATATVIGGAVAFGAQTLVRDVISGFFVLAEDQYGTGDSVDLGLASGVVERITLRSVRLRDGEGKIWYVPHGGVARVGNLSKTTAVQLHVHVARQSKLGELHRVATALGERLTEVAGQWLTAPPTVVGLVDLADDRIVYGVAAQISPGRQDEVRRAWRALVLDAFERGELVPPQAPTTTVRVDGGAAPEPEQNHSVTEPE